MKRRQPAFTLVELPAVSRRAFTLVELLVVIGIIAILIGVLLPALAAARRQANATKCASALREIGNCFKMYEIDSKGWFPPGRLGGWASNYPSGTVTPYTIDDTSYPTPAVPPSARLGQAYWFTFLAKYATKAKMGNAAQTDETEGASSRKTIFFGCPSWEGYTVGGSIVGGVNLVQLGYGMNTAPYYNSYQYIYPAPIAQGYNTLEDAIDPGGVGGSVTKGKWYKSSQWTRSAQRILVADSLYWSMFTNQFALVGGKPPPPAASYPQAVVPQQSFDNTGSNFLSQPGQTSIDIYRHGKIPSGRTQYGSVNCYDPYGGKISYNVLYADGHVSNQSDGRETYQAYFMRFP